MKTGTLPRLALARSNHGAGGTRTEPAGLQPDFKDRDTGRRLRPAPGEGRGLSHFCLGGALRKWGAAANQASTQGLGRGARALQALVC